MKHLVLATILTVVPFVSHAQKLESPTFVAPEGETDLSAFHAHQLERHQLWTALQNQRAAVEESARIVVPLGAVERQALTAPSDDRIGVHQALDAAFSFEREPVLERAAIRDGEAVWTTSLESPGATGMRLRFSRFHMPRGTALYLYTDYGQVHGPYSGYGPLGTGEFWSHTVYGDRVWVQAHDTSDRPRPFARATFDIATISHLGPALEVPAKFSGVARADCSANVDCVVNVNCYEDQPLNTARRAVAKLIFETANATKRCTGSTLNDSDSTGRTPWLLTANHCINTEAEANSVEAQFQYQSPCGTCDGDSPESVLGGTLWARGADDTGDFALLELSGLPTDWGLMGWTNANVRDAVGTEINCLSHPQGTPQSYSRHEVVAPRPSKPAKFISKPIFGAADAGSSGAPMFLDGGLVVGVNSVASPEPGETIDLCTYTTYEERNGAFSYFWKSVAPYLGSPSRNYEMHVADVVADAPYDSLFRRYAARATVTVVDELGNGVPHVTVSGDFSGSPNASASATTDANGQAKVWSPRTQASEPDFTFCVTGLSHDYFNTYDSASNEVTCDSH